MSFDSSTVAKYVFRAAVGASALLLASAATADPPAAQSTAAIEPAGIGSARSTAAAVNPTRGSAPAGHEGAYKSFDEFAADWMQKMERAEAHGRAHPTMQAVAGRPSHSYRGYDGTDRRIELKPTGQSAVPYVGILRYRESTYSCADKTATQCTVTDTMPVTEIFRFQNGRWVY